MSATPTPSFHDPPHRPRRGRRELSSVEQCIRATRGLMSLMPASDPNPDQPSWAASRPPAMRDAMTRLLLSVEALGAGHRERIFTHSALDRAWFIFAWEEAKALGWLGIAGYDGHVGIWALMEAGVAEAEKIGVHLESAYARQIMRQAG